MKRRSRLLVLSASVAVGAASLTAVPLGATALGATSSSTTATPPTAFTPGLALLDSSGQSTGAAEPTIELDSHDNAYVTGPVGVPTGGCPFWWVHPDKHIGGKVYAYRGKFDTDHGSVGGGDCDISTLPSTDAANAGHFDQVGASSLSLANLTTNTTTDGGATFMPVANSLGQQVFGVDRQWQRADPGLGVTYITVHDAATDNIQVATSIDGGYTYVQNTPAIDAAHQGTATGSNGNYFGALVINPTNHHLYIPFIAPADPIDSAYHVVYVAEGDPCAVSCTPGLPPGPIAWTDYTVYVGPDGAELGHIFPAAAIDSKGQVYISWIGDTTSSATNRVYVAASHGTDVSQWQAPYTVDTGDDHSNMFAWVVAGKAGVVDAAWLGSTLLDPSDGPCPDGATGSPDDGDGVNNNCHQTWTVKFAQVQRAGTRHPQVAVTDASVPMHKGSICDQGLNCDLIGGDRTLADFFDMDLDRLGRANIAFPADISTPGQPQVVYTRQCSGLTARLAKFSRSCAALGPAYPDLG